MAHLALLTVFLLAGPVHFKPLPRAETTVPITRYLFYRSIADELPFRSDFDSDTIGSMGETGAQAEFMFPCGRTNPLFLLQSESIPHPVFVLSEFKLSGRQPVQVWRVRLLKAPRRRIVARACPLLSYLKEEAFSKDARVAYRACCQEHLPLTTYYFDKINDFLVRYISPDGISRLDENASHEYDSLASTASPKATTSAATSHDARRSNPNQRTRNLHASSARCGRSCGLRGLDRSPRIRRRGRARAPF